jgi:electron transfer flavoprotein beta subunit
MKIAVCFKVVPDFDQVVEADWDNFSLAADLGYVRRIFGCFDESALETALRLRSAWEALGEKTECTALTAAPLPSPLCKTLFAAGFDRVLDLSGVVSGQYQESGGGSLPPAPAAPGASSAPPSAGEPPRNAPLPPLALSEFQPRRVAAALGSLLGSAGYDLILAGREAGWADTGAVPLLLAETLGLPVISGAGEIAPCAGGVEVIRTTSAGRERLRARLPLLVTLGNGPVAALRAATLGERMAASRREAETPPGTGGAAAGPGPTPNFRREERRKTCRFLPGGADLAHSAAELRAAYLGADQ